MQITATAKLDTTMFLLLLLLVVPLNAQQASGDAALVQQFFPQSLITESAADFRAGGPPSFQASAFAEADLNGTGNNDFIVAAYTNGFSAVVRVLRKQGTSAVLANEPQVPLLGGIYPTVTLIDLDNDGKPEVVMGLSSARGGVADWIFKWDGSALRLFGPTEGDLSGNTTTMLGDAVFVDLDGDGIPEVINPPEFNSVHPGSPGPFVYTVFALKNGVYAPTGATLNFFQTYVRAGGTPVATGDTFTVKDATIPYVITIVNGDQHGGKRVSSATITLNGTVVAGPDVFNQGVAALKIPVAVSTNNSITVQLASAPGSELTVSIGPK
jgi:hypothetical protein